MRRIIFFVFAQLIQATALFAQGKGFEINGHLDGLNEGEMVMLGNRFLDGHYLTYMDSCSVHNGHFSLRAANVDSGPRFFEVYFPSSHRTYDTASGKNTGGNTCVLFLDNGDSVWIKGGDINKMNHEEFQFDVDIEGSPSNTARLALWPLTMDYVGCYYEIRRKIEKSIDSLGFDRDYIQAQIEAKSILDEGLYGAVKNQYIYYKTALPDFIYELSDDLSRVGSYHGAFIPNMYNKLSPYLKKSFYGRRAEKLARLCIGQKLPNFELAADDGQLINLEKLVGKYKLTIIHFWASNSYQREQYQKELLSFYKKYQDKGLNVIAVSADTVEDDWKYMVHLKKYPWTNVSDLKGWGAGSIINDVYNEGGHSVPNTTNVLLDSDGRIIAWDPQGPEFEWYLWKYLGQ